MIFHVLHAAMHTLLQPGFEPAGIFIQFFCFGNTAIEKTQLLGRLFDDLCMLGQVGQEIRYNLAVKLFTGR